MKTSVRYFLAILVIGLTTVLWATSPGASSEHFVLTNNSDYMGGNYGTRLKLLGNPGNLSFKTKDAFATGGTDGAASSIPDIQIIQHGPYTCVFLSDSTSGDIA